MNKQEIDAFINGFLQEVTRNNPPERAIYDAAKNLDDLIKTNNIQTEKDVYEFARNHQDFIDNCRKITPLYHQEAKRVFMWILVSNSILV